MGLASGPSKVRCAPGVGVSATSRAWARVRSTIGDGFCAPGGGVWLIAPGEWDEEGDRGWLHDRRDALVDAERCACGVEFTEYVRHGRRRQAGKINTRTTEDQEMKKRRRPRTLPGRPRRKQNNRRRLRLEIE